MESFLQAAANILPNDEDDEDSFAGAEALPRDPNHAEPELPEDSDSDDDTEDGEGEASDASDEDGYSGDDEGPGGNARDRLTLKRRFDIVEDQSGDEEDEGRVTKRARR